MHPIGIIIGVIFILILVALIVFEIMLCKAGSNGNDKENL